MSMTFESYAFSILTILKFTEFNLLDSISNQRRRHRKVDGYQRTRFTSKSFFNGKSSSIGKEDVTG